MKTNHTDNLKCVQQLITPLLNFISNLRSTGLLLKGSEI